MDEERKRILRMLAEGTITVEECQELLEALSQRREEAEAAPQTPVERPKWPYVLLIVLAVLAAGSVVLGLSLPAFRRGGGFLFPFSMVMPMGLLGIVTFVFWIWMVVDCLGRAPYDFRLLFTQKREHDKWIWLAIVILTNWIGALLYFILIRQPAQSIAPVSAAPRRSAPQAPPVDPTYVPPPRAGSLAWLAVLCVIALLLGLLAGTALVTFAREPASVGPGPSFLGAIPVWPELVTFLPAVFLVVATVVFWLCMLISCIVRDYRDFGTIIPSDPAADKLVWVLLILFLPVIGAIAYHIAIRRRIRRQPA